MVGYRFFACDCRHALHRLLVLAASLCLCTSALATTLRVALEDADNRPYAYRDERGEWTGFHSELIRAVAKQLEWDVLFIPVPWTRAQNMLVQGTADAVPYMGKNAQRLNYALFLPDNRLHIQHVSLYIRRADSGRIEYTPPLTTLMQQWRFGAPRNYFVGDEFIQALAAGAPMDQTAPTPQKLFAMLLAGRIDIAVAEAQTFQIVEPRIRDAHVRIIRLAGVTLEGTAMYLAFRRAGAGPQQAQEFAAAYAAWRKSAEYAQLIDRFGIADRIPEDFRAQALRPSGSPPQARPR